MKNCKYLLLVVILTAFVAQAWGAVTALTIPKSWAASGGSSAYTEALGCTKNGLGSDYSASGTKLKFDNTGDYMIIQLASSPAYVSYAITGNSFSGGTFKVQESSNGSDYTDVATYTSSPSGTKTNNLKATTRYIKFVYTTKSSGNIGLGTIVIKARTSVTLDKNEGTADGSAVIAYNATTTESITTPTNAGSTLLGYWEGASTGNKVLNADGSFAASSVSGWITSNKWTKDAATAKLYARWEAACDNNVNISKGSETNGTFTLSKTGSQATCSGLSVEVTPSPAANYHIGNVTATTPTTGGTPTITSPTEGKYIVTYAANSTGSSTINVSFEEDPQYTITWVAGSNASFHTQTNYSGIALTDPGTPSAATYCPGGKVFVGWTETEIVGTTDTKPVDLFTSVSGMTIPATNKTYYAVFATESVTEGSPTTVKYNISSKNTLTKESGEAPSGSSISIAETYSTSCQMTSGNSQTLTLQDWGVVKISNITLFMRSNKSSGAGRLYYNVSDQVAPDGYIVGSNTEGVAFNNAVWHNSWSTDYVSISKDIDITSIANKKIKFILYSTANSIYCQSYQITYKLSSVTTYSDYATSCCTPLGAIKGSLVCSNRV